MWLMMSVEGPYLTALIARMHEPEFNLAAYGVAFSVALIVESPIMMLLSASIALVENRSTFLKLRNFVYGLNIVLTIFMLVLIIPPIFNTLAIDILNLPERVAYLTHIAVIILIPWAPAIGYRRFYQGLLIKNNLTRRVAYGTVVRLIAMLITGFLLFSFTNLHGVVIGASALSSGVIFDALATRFMILDVLKTVSTTQPGEKSISYKEIMNFYVPLILTSFISLGVQPIVTFFMGQSVMALESLAVLPVLNGLVFIFRAFGLSYQEVGVALIKSKHDYIILKNFAMRLGLVVVIGLAAISLTPLGDIWLMNVAGLSRHLTEFSDLPLLLYTIFPALTVWINFQRSVLVYVRNTKQITFASSIEVLSLLIVLLITVKFLSIVGAVAAVIAYTIARLMSTGYLISPFTKAKKIIFSRPEVSEENIIQQEV